MVLSGGCGFLAAYLLAFGHKGPLVQMGVALVGFSGAVRAYTLAFAEGATPAMGLVALPLWAGLILLLAHMIVDKRK